MALFPQKDNVVFTESAFSQMPNLLTSFFPEEQKYEDVVKVYEVGSDQLQIMYDVVSQKAVCFFK